VRFFLYYRAIFARVIVEEETKEKVGAPDLTQSSENANLTPTLLI